MTAGTNGHKDIFLNDAHRRELRDESAISRDVLSARSYAPSRSPPVPTTATWIAGRRVHRGRRSRRRARAARPACASAGADRTQTPASARRHGDQRMCSLS
jgi:hypothetical protein